MRGALLRGYRVLELGGGAGAIAGRLFASLGATVVRVEQPGGDPIRHEDPRFPLSPRWLWANLDKQILELDLPVEAPRLADRLGAFDVLIDGHEPGGLAGLGLDPVALRERHPGLIVLQLSHFGQDGPYSGRAGSGLTSFALGGSLFRSGRAVDAPIPPPVELADTIGGLTGALAAVARLAASRGEWDGDSIDCAVSEACLATSDWAIPLRSLMGITSPRNGAGPVYPVYPVRDGFVRVLNLSPRQWQAFVAWLGNPPEISAPEWQSLPYRAANADVIDLVCQQRFGDRGREELFHEAQQAGVSLVPVYAPEDIPNDAHFKERRALATVEVPLGGDGGATLHLTVPRGYVRFGKGDIPPDPAPPRFIDALPPFGRHRARARLDFSSLLVVELGSGGVAPEAARHLARFGATVLKIEHPSALDFMRTTAGPGMHEFTGNWASSNRNKRSVELDLKSDEGREAMFRLLSRADVFFENNSGGVTDRLGIGYEAVVAANPGIVYCSSQMFGATGPASSYSGFGPSNHAASGIAHLWSHPDNPKPEGNTLVHPDHLAGKTLAIAAIAALDERQRTGRGQFIDLAQAEFAMATIAEAFVEMSLLGKTERRGQDHPVFVPHGVYPTLLPDEWVAIAVENDEQWAGVVRAIGSPEWATDAELRTAEGRRAARAAVREGLSAWTRQRTRQFVVNALARERVPAMAVLSPVEQLADPHLNARAAFAAIDHPLAGLGRFEALPFRYTNWELAPEERAPLLGEHTAMLAAELRFAP